MIYLDNAATTKMYKSASDIIKTYNEEFFFNPSALYKHAQKISVDIENARKTVAECIGASPSEIFFTSCATESNNTVIKCARKNKSGLILTTEGEHPSIYNTVRDEINRGASGFFLPLEKSGRVRLDISDLKIIGLASIIHVSNEMGAINDIESIVKEIRGHSKDAIIHSDGVQAVGKMSVNVKKLGVDLYSISGHKCNGPKGIAALYVKEGIKINSLLNGGIQEKRLRAGTENVAGIMAFAYSLNKKCKENDTIALKKRKKIITDKLAATGLSIVSDKDAAPSIISAIANGIRGEILIRILCDNGVIVGTGAACSSKLSDNRVLRAMGLSAKEISSAIRISFDESISIEAISAATDIICREYKRFLSK